VLSPACRDTVPPITLAYTFNTVDEIEMIVEYKPKIYFPENIWTGLHTQNGVSCYGTYTQTITMDKSVSGVTVYDSGSSPYLKISDSAPDKETFSLTFTGTYVALDGVTTTTESFVQRYKIRNVFSLDFVEQLEWNLLASPDKYTHELDPVDPGTPAERFQLKFNDFEVLYKFKESLVDELGNTPPVLSHLPWTTFSSSDLNLGEPTLGTVVMDDPLGELQNSLDSAEFGSSDPIEYECPSWNVDKVPESV